MKLSDRCLILHSGSPIACPVTEKLYKRPCSEKKGFRNRTRKGHCLKKILTFFGPEFVRCDVCAAVTYEIHLGGSEAV
jgi:hypothetical protein